MSNLFFYDYFRSTTSSSTSSGAESGSGSGSNSAATLEPTERKVRDTILRLKADRVNLEASIQLVTLPLESALVDPLPRDILPLADARKMDLEMAVIMQELMAMKEERSRLRAQVYALEKHRANESKHQAKMQSTSNASADSPVGQSADASQREKKLQSRVEELAATVERVTQNAEARQQKSAELVADLKKANS